MNLGICTSTRLKLSTFMSILPAKTRSIIRVSLCQTENPAWRNCISLGSDNHLPGKTLKSGCLPLLIIHRFWHSRRVRAVVRVWLGFGLGVSVSANDSLSDAV
eukprot:sb/3478187/